MKADFKNLMVEVSFDNFDKVDTAKAVGNFIHANTPDIGLDDVAREIYHSEGEIEISGQHAADIVAMVSSNQCMFLAAVKKAIVKQLTQ